MMEGVWPHGRAETLGRELYDREDGPYTRSEADELMLSRATEDDVDLFFSRAEYPFEPRRHHYLLSPPQEENTQMHTRGAKDFFKNVWRTIKKIGGKVVQKVANVFVRSDLEEELSERSEKVHTRAEELVYRQKTDGSQLSRRGAKEFFKKVWRGIKNVANKAVNILGNALANKAASGAKFVASKVKI